MEPADHHARIRNLNSVNKIISMLGQLYQILIFILCFKKYKTCSPMKILINLKMKVLKL